MAGKPLPSQEVLRQLLDYNPETGALTWKARGVEWFPAKTPARSAALCRLWNERYAGKPALTCVSIGYFTGAILGQNYKAHRVAWKLRYGTDPDQIDHINGNRKDNRINNLRDVNAADNAKNRKKTIDNKSGMMGISLWKHRGFQYWAVSDPRKSSDTYFHCLGRAIAARRAVEREHGFHPNHGRKS